MCLRRANVAAQEERAELAHRRGQDLALDDGVDRRRRALGRLEHDVAGEAVGDHDVDLAAEDVAPLDVADELEVLVDRRREQLVAPRVSSVPLIASSPFDKRPTRGRGLPCSRRA